jgi:gliding motility-associated-like protein
LKKILFIWMLFSLFLQIEPAWGHEHNAFAPVEYVRNLGQWEGDFLYKATTTHGDIYLKKDGFRIVQMGTDFHDIRQKLHNTPINNLTCKYHVYDMIFERANSAFGHKLDKEQKHYYNYFLGNNSSNWKSNIHPGLAVDYTSIYPGIDAHIYSEAGHIKYDLVVSPGSSTDQIAIAYKGVNGLRIDNKKLIVSTSVGDNTELAPYAYQFENGTKKEVICQYMLSDNNTIGFSFPKGYNKKETLYIDPILVFSTLTGSTADNWGFTATYDTLGNFFSGGIANSVGYPGTVGAFQATFAGGGASGGGFQCDAVISKFNAAGNALLWSTYLGGADNDQPHSIVVDQNDNLAIAGRTYSVNFPTSAGCFDASPNGGADLFVTKLNAGGTALIGSTYMGGNGNDGENITPIYTSLASLKHNYGDDARSEIICDANNNMWIAASTSSANFPTQQANQAALSGLQDGVIFQLNNNCSNLMWSTYWGGTGNDACYVLTFDKTTPNILYVAGGTESANLPVTAGTLNPSALGGTDGFLLKFNATTKALLAGTFIGTNSYDQVYGVQTDDSQHVYVMGQTQGAYPVTAGVYSNPNSPQFVTKINNTLTGILASTVYGSGNTAATNISPVAFLVDKCGSIYVSGWGGPTGGNPGTTFGMPTTANAIQTTTDGSDFYFIVFSKNFQNLLYASFFGQNGGGGEHVDGGTSRFDPNGVIYQAICAACGGSQLFPTTPGSWSTINGSLNCNLGAVKIDFQLQNPDAIAAATSPLKGCIPFTVSFINNSSSATNYIWDFGDGSPTSSAFNPSHTYTTAGTFTVTLIALNPNGCTASTDTTQLIVTALDDSLFAGMTIVKTDSCNPYIISLTNTTTTNYGSPCPGATYTWSFGDGNTFSGPNPGTHQYATGGTYVVTLTITDTCACNSPSVATGNVDFTSSIVTSGFTMPDSICLPALVNFIDQSSNATTWNWSFGDGNTSTQTNPSNNYTNVGNYTVYLISGNPATCNKFDTSSKTITIFPSPIADFKWAPDPPEPNTPNSFTNLSVGATRYLWDFGDGTTDTVKNPIHIYQKDGTYNVCLTATNQYGCTDTVCKPVRGMVIPLVDVPTGFTPNGDGINDVVYVKGYGVEKMTFRIFNRWGEKIFESTDKNIGWDGRYKNVIQEMEVYGYTLSVTFFDGSKDFKKGNITLLK